MVQKKCSGLETSQYHEARLSEIFGGFNALGCRFHDHVTPFGTAQNFIFCTFGKDRIKSYKKASLALKTSQSHNRAVITFDIDEDTI